MARRQARRAVFRVGQLAEVCVDNRHALLEDMAIIDPNGYLLQGIYMSGRISSVTKNYIGVDLPAAEGTLRFPKEKAKLLANDHKQCEMFVVFDKEIKKIVGLRMSGGFRPKDYYDELDEAKSHVAKMTKKTTDVAKSKSETASANKQLTVGAEPETPHSQPPAPKTVTTTPTTTPSDTSTINSVNAGSLAILANVMTAEESEISACNPVPETNMNPQPPNPPPTPTPTPENQSSQVTSTTTSISNTESSPAASPAVRRSSRGHGAGATVRVPENAQSQGVAELNIDTPSIDELEKAEGEGKVRVFACHTGVGTARIALSFEDAIEKVKNPEVQVVNSEATLLDNLAVTEVRLRSDVKGKRKSVADRL